MSKEEVLEELDALLNKYENDKDGMYVQHLLLDLTKELIIKDRPGVVGALRHWLNLREGGLTVAAMNLIADINIPELKPELECLRKEIESRKIFLPDYVYWVDRALKAISEK
jgi:hypothetical protein